MKTSVRIVLSTVFAVALGLSATSSVNALPVISNGGFEAGLASWTTANQLGSEGSFFTQSGTLSPVNKDPVSAPPQGTTAAMTDAPGPGSHVLYQDFTATAGAAALSFSLFIGNRADRFATPTPASLDFSTPALNQQARVDIIKNTADPLSVAAGDVLLNLYQTKVGDPLVSGYNTIATDITTLLAAHSGEMLRLRFAETDNLFTFQLGVDNVRFDPIPEPASILLFGAALALLVGWRGRRLLAAHRCIAVVAMLGAVIIYPVPARADTTPPAMLDPNLQVTTVLSTGIDQPIGIVFLGMNDFLVLEKATGQIKRVINGVIQQNPVLDLAVNSNSERGLLSMVLHPNFPAMPFAYIRWTESSTGVDSGAVTDVPLRGNRLDRFIWDGSKSTLTIDRNLIMLRSRQTDNVAVPGHPGTNNANEQGNHNGGVLRFGPDGKLYLFMGDQGRRGWMQNLPNGPFLTAPQVDDTFGGPEPDNAHLSGVILRFNDDGSTPTDNPFFAVGGAMGGEVGANIQKIFSYGHRNSFGMAFDPNLGSLWLTENADDAYSELNRVIPGMNGGWVQLAGPLSRISDWRLIEVTQFPTGGPGALQQVRYPPTRAAYTAGLALARMFMLPGATYVDPDLSWRYEIGPAGTTFVKGTALGAEYDGTLWMGSARSNQQVGANGGSLYRFEFTPDRLHVDVSADPRLADRVADNLFRTNKFDGTESETLQIGTGFGTTPSIEQGPDGNLYVVSLTDNAIYKISRRP
jgi:glucose/arabinose dehydrogenase